MVRIADDIAEPALLLRSAIKVNERQRGILFEKIQTFFDGNIQGKTIALWGLAFKANTDDMREAPSITLIDLLTRAGARVRAYDPAATGNARQLFKTYNPAFVRASGLHYFGVGRGRST